MPKKSAAPDLPQTVQRLARIHFLLVGAFAAQIILFDSWQLITPRAVLQRWFAALLLLAAVTIIWYMSHSNKQVSAKRLLFGLVTADILFSIFAVYSQRGMASRAVLLFLIPIIVSAALRSRSAIIATSILCVGAYIGAAVSYFVLNFNEGYKIELYGEVGFYSLVFLITGVLLVAINTTSNQR